MKELTQSSLLLGMGEHGVGEVRGTGVGDSGGGQALEGRKECSDFYSCCQGDLPLLHGIPNICSLQMFKAID